MKYVTSQTVSLHIQADLRAYAQVTEPFLFNTFDERSSLTMNGDYMHFQMLIDSVIPDRFNSQLFDNYSSFAKSKNEFIEACKEIYKSNARTIAKIEEFGRTYRPEQAVYWYTRDSFLYSLLNRALRTNDTKLILIFRFFIIDLHKQLADKYCKPFTEENEHDLSPVYYVYRGQLMPKYELNSLRKSLGNIISMKSFLSTSLDQQMALFYLGENNDSIQSSLIPVLIEIDLGNSNSCSNYQTLFANITEYSDFGEAEKEVLFMVGSYFRVDDVRRDEKGVWHVRLTALGISSDPLDKRSKWGALYHHMQTSFIHPMFNSPSDTGAILFQSGKFDQTQMYYVQMLPYLSKLVYVSEEMNDNDEHELSSSSENKSGGFQDSLAGFTLNSYKRKCFENERAQKIFQCYYLFGRIANEKGFLALSTTYYEMLLKRILPSSQTHEQPSDSINHVLRALCRLGLGSTYELNGQLKRAFESYTKALHMFEQAHDGYVDNFADGSDLTHVFKARCLIGLGNLCLIEQKVKRADTHYHEALSIFDKYLPLGHPDITRSRQKIANIVQIYRCKPAVALEDYEDCLENYLRSLPSDHVDTARVYRDMACAYEQLPNGLE
jgi:hypothetical protein